MDTDTAWALFALIITGLFVLFLAIVKRKPTHDTHCPDCGALGMKLFGGLFRLDTIKTVDCEARELVKNALFCLNGKNPIGAGLCEKYFCPKCLTWNLRSVIK
ncbi:MAG: hypothetical protein UV62_C0038G0006 [Parcubacteria group bacterium GW2011_GWC1_43_11]|nr:MAG: hypothetical protein UV62_C0038G0006 [Parcubacteria group bacterium GW2011_GWC1_43_11]